VLAVVLGYLNFQFLYLFLALAILYGVIISLIAVYLEGIAYKRYPRLASLLKLSLYSFLENLGYRQLNSWWRSKAYVTYFTRKRKWGKSVRMGYKQVSSYPPPAA